MMSTGEATIQILSLFIAGFARRFFYWPATWLALAWSVEDVMSNAVLLLGFTVG